MPNRIWVDVEDLFQYAALNARLSGIQRIEFELCRSLALMPEARDRIGFVRHAPGQQGFRAIPFAAIDALHERLTGDDGAAPRPAPPAPRGDAPGPTRPAWPAATGGGGLARRVAYRLPSDVRLPLTRLLRSQREGLHAAGTLGRAAAGRFAQLGRRDTQAAGARGGDDTDGLTVAAFAGTVAPGDVLLVPGSTWFHPFYGELVATARERWQMRVAVLIYDIIPLLRPEWCDQNLVARFRHWALGLLPQADILLTISQATARDLRQFAARSGIALRAPPLPIPVGTGFSRPVARAGTARPAPASRGTRLPAPGTYVLTVSTIEARKNHALLFRVWRRLLDEMPAAIVPTLVFAGRVGWLVDDLMAQLRNADWLDGKIVLIADPQDSELAQLYAGCRFTVFPSHYEGWGLPVTESLGFGRPCVVSNASALPEAGGTLARYFDPENGTEATRVIRRAIEDVDGTEAWAARVAAEFRPVSWDECALAVLRALDQDRPRAALAVPGRASHLV